MVHMPGCMANQYSDIDLLVVLSEMESAFTEIDRLNDIKYNISLEYEVHISANPVSENTYSHSTLPLLKIYPKKVLNYE